jgi:hypothetical protein
MTAPGSIPNFQLPIPNEFPTPNSQKFGNWELGVYWELRVGRWELTTYSYLRARMGSMRLARCAGIRPAAAETSARRTTVEIAIDGSCG